MQPRNIDVAYVKGVEANAQVRFTFLPSPLDGFGTAANYAHIEGHGEGTILGATPRTGDAPWRRYIGAKDQLVERERYDYSFRWGVQLHF